MSKTVTDPLGNQICVPRTILEATEKMVQSEDVVDDIYKMIEKPAMLFKIKEDSTRLFYLRAIGWNTTIVIEAHQVAQGFKVVNYQLNPGMEYIRDLHTKSERLI